MTFTTETSPTPPATPTRKPWIVPDVDVIRAGDAETSTRGNAQDGTFTTS